LVYFEVYEDEVTAIGREKYLKKCYKKTKIKLITEQNLQWNDLYDEITPI
jgi:predicted GIY-YIG superfamily endonuclease